MKMSNPDRVTYFAATDNRGKRVPFGIKAKDRARHMYVIGKTGMGKSTLLENMAVQDIVNGEGVAFIDPHGSAVETLLSYVPEHRLKDVVYFAPFDLENPIAFNVMEDVGYDKRHLVVSGLMATFKKIWVDAWSARMEYILSNTLLALLEYPDATLLGVNRMYVDKEYRKKVVENVKDPVVKDFWTKEFAAYTDRYTQEATPAIQNKIGQFTSNPLIRNIIGQAKSSFDVRTLMDEKKILLINLSKGLVGDVNMRLLGSMLTTRIFLGAMSRADLDPATLKKAPPFYFYVDEFQNFANETFAEILSEARKYNLNLIMAHQYVEQMEEEVRAAVFGNVGTTVAFRVGPFDAEVLETIFMPEFTKEDLVNLGQYQIYTTLMIDGVGSRPFSATTLPTIATPQKVLRNEVIEASRATFATKRAGIEKMIFDELASMPAPEPPPPRPDWKRAKAQGNTNGGGNQNVPKKNPPPPPRPAPQDTQSLKAALAEMTEKIQKANENKRETQVVSLKEVVATITPPPQKEMPPPKPVQGEAPKPDTKPFEVPEEALRAVFSDKE
jgi:energy-coupling factor transporter ATP-binding protein EcfA2